MVCSARGRTWKHQNPTTPLVVTMKLSLCIKKYTIWSKPLLKMPGIYSFYWCLAILPAQTQAFQTAGIWRNFILCWWLHLHITFVLVQLQQHHSQPSSHMENARPEKALVVLWCYMYKSDEAYSMYVPTVHHCWISRKNMNNLLCQATNCVSLACAGVRSSSIIWIL